jgi:phosphoenolpyruvate carboxykinase (ATP)
MVDAALTGKLNNVEFIQNDLFHLNIPQSCENVPTEILNPINTWENKEDYKRTSENLAKKFSDEFDKSYGKQNIDPGVISQCPGK